MKDEINKGIANPHTQHQRIANSLERVKNTAYDFFHVFVSSF